MNDRTANLPTIQFYTSSSYPCSYLPNTTARSLVAMPLEEINAALYSQLALNGFRRSGEHVYKPFCAPCMQCVPVRIVVDQFVPNRSQKRNQKQWQHLQQQWMPLQFHEQHFELYKRYQKARHAGGGMDQDDAEQYQQFLVTSLVDTTLLTFYETTHSTTLQLSQHSPSPPPATDDLKMVSVVDYLRDGLSAVYTFYDPDIASGLGTHSVLCLIEHAKQLELPYVYLGYWIKDSQKMNYKTLFQPLEGFIDGKWQPLAT